MLFGDFNCPDIDWNTLTVNNQGTDRVQQALIETTSSYHLTQVHDKPTREDNNSLPIKSSTNVSGLSVHDMVIVDSITKPHFNHQAPRKRHLFTKANWNELQREVINISVNIIDAYVQDNDIDFFWELFKTSILLATEKFMPSNMFRQKNSTRLLNRKLRGMLKKKGRLFNQAKTTGKCGNFEEKLTHYNTKPFWRFIKFRNQDNIGVSPLKLKGNLMSNSRDKAEILIYQFSLVLTKDSSTDMPP